MERELWQHIEEIERKAEMKYVTSVERLAIERGMAKGLAKGLAEGLAKGLAEGKLEGKLETLTRILARRFGPLPGWVDERLRHAGAEQLDAWLDRCVDAPTLAEVLGEH
jgi:hypothetical protein